MCSASPRVSSSCSSASSASLQNNHGKSTCAGSASSHGWMERARAGLPAAAAADWACRSSSRAAMWALHRDSSAPSLVMAAVSGTDRITCVRRGVDGAGTSSRCASTACRPAARRRPPLLAGQAALTSSGSMSAVATRDQPMPSSSRRRSTLRQAGAAPCHSTSQSKRRSGCGDVAAAAAAVGARRSARTNWARLSPA